MTYGFKMANNVTDLRVTGDVHVMGLVSVVVHVWYWWYRIYMINVCVYQINLLPTGMLKDVEEELQRRVKVQYFHSTFFP